MDQDQGEYSKEETARRATAALRTALNTPPKPHKPVEKKTKKLRQPKGRPEK
jgi:hypothetical protein